MNYFSTADSGKGFKPDHPSVLVPVLIYGYETEVFSRPRLEKACKDLIAFHYICADTHSDHDTLTHFKKRFLKELEEDFR